MKYFVAGSTARTVAELAGHSSQYVFFTSHAPPLPGNNKERAAQFAGEIELDESYSAKRKMR